MTVVAFVQAYRAIRRGDSRAANVMFRYRVGAQAFTVLAMVAGSMYYAKDRERSKELNRLREQQRAEEKREKWIRELEARDDEDKAMRAALERRKAGGREQAAAAAAAKTAPAVEAEAPVAEQKKAVSGGILGALGLWAKPKEEGESPRPAEPEAPAASKRERNPRSSLGDLGAIINKKPDDKDNK